LGLSRSELHHYKMIKLLTCIQQAPPGVCAAAPSPASRAWRTLRYTIAGLAISLHGAAAPVLEKLTLGGPAAVVSYPLMHMVESDALQAYARKVEFRLWESHDQLSALLTHQQLDFSAAPTTLPALLFNRGQHTRLLSVSVWGLVWLLSTDPDIQGFEDLVGQELLSPFQQDLGSVLIDTLLNRLQPAVRIRRTRSGQDAIALMLSGQGRHVVLPEPMASMLLWRNAQQATGVPLHRVQSLESAWQFHFPMQPTLPQAGLMVNSSLSNNRGLSLAIEKAYATSSRWCKSETLQCAQLAHKYLPHIPVAVLQQAIAITHLESLPASAVRTELEALFQLIATRHPKVLGGQLPASDFYGP
jgi:NitT/TauT family transport system substrate-binding protein